MSGGFVGIGRSSPETAKEIKLFGLNGFLAGRFDRFAQAMYADNSRQAIRRAAWGALLTGGGTLAYYHAMTKRKPITPLDPRQRHW